MKKDVIQNISQIKYDMSEILRNILLAIKCTTAKI